MPLICCLDLEGVLVPEVWIACISTLAMLPRRSASIVALLRALDCFWVFAILTQSVKMCLTIVETPVFVARTR